MRDRRTEIVDAAIGLMSRVGYGQTSIEDVIREAGLCGKGHFYHHFKSKEALGFAVLERQFARFADYGLSLLGDAEHPPLDRLAMFIDEIVATQEDCDCAMGCPFGNLAAEMAESHEGFRMALEGVFSKWAGALESLLREAGDRLQEGTDPARLAQFIIATLEGAMLVGRVQRRVETMTGIAEDLKRFVRMHAREQGAATRVGAGA